MSSVKEYVKQFTAEYINKNIDNEEVRNFLLNHERKNILIDNISRELLKAEYKAIRIDIILLKQVAYDFARMFCNAALEQKKQQLWSLTEKITQEKKYNEQVELQKEVENEIANVEHFDT